ncbi:hypothetical protein O5D80_008189 [Batrachochytrium dendrobatidis]|nr:hypothetical protein O5D80_008189 [Batrachochytrium dendrobatidis]
MDCALRPFPLDSVADLVAAFQALPNSPLAFLLETLTLHYVVMEWRPAIIPGTPLRAPTGSATLSRGKGRKAVLSLLIWVSTFTGWFVRY